MSTFFVGYYMKRFVVYKVNSNNIHVIILTVWFTLHLHYEYLCTKYIKNTVYLNKNNCFPKNATDSQRKFIKASG